MHFSRTVSNQSNFHFLHFFENAINMFHLLDL